QPGPQPQEWRSRPRAIPGARSDSTPERCHCHHRPRGGGAELPPHMTTAPHSITVRPVSLVRLSRIVAASPPMLVSLLILKLWLSGTLGYYVNNRTVWVVLVGAALFALVGAVTLRTA